jgi:hypothetical protein
MGSLLIFLGWVAAGYIGYTGLEWYFVFVGSLLAVIGYMIARSGQMYGVYSDDGRAGFIKMFVFQMVGWSITTFIIYFVAQLFN